MAAFISGDCVNFKNMNDIPNALHNSFLFNQIHDMDITSPLKFMDDIFESFPNLFFLTKCLKMDKLPYPNWE